MPGTKRTQIRGKTWTKKTTIDSRKFDQVSKAILASLTREPVTFTEMVERVAKKLPKFEGSVAWYTISCARELEVRGKVARSQKPVRYFKGGRRAASQ
jgi:hypothetical protein